MDLLRPFLACSSLNGILLAVIEQLAPGSRSSRGFRIISLLAGKHTFGGVEHAPSRILCPHDPNNNLSLAHFDPTFVHFDKILSFFEDSPELFTSTYARYCAEERRIHRGVPVKAHNLVLNMACGTRKMSSKFGYCTVWLLWDDHAGGKSNATLAVFSAVRRRYSATWYTFVPKPTTTPAFLSLHATAGITIHEAFTSSSMERWGLTNLKTALHLPYKMGSSSRRRRVFVFVSLDLPFTGWTSRYLGPPIACLLSLTTPRKLAVFKSFMPFAQLIAAEVDGRQPESWAGPFPSQDFNGPIA
ncbi:hypothetical protein DFH08DRAFT_819646 [Mycena albidolilacea]|uniref:Uncharacterized protein n=1 Tax=Mycena albidolilacea TaxID=1033008 RepID=A0AAD6ZDT0_9AGAR|nr:hypothetical protein DFH08DRAFT_819646 [Mycena albidolilacea]